MSDVHVFFPKQCGHTEGFLRSGLRPGGSGLRPGVHSRWYHTCARFWMTHTAQEFPHLPFSKDVSHEMVAGRPLFRRARFTSTPCSFFELCPFHLASMALSGHFEVWNAFLCDRCRTSGTFSSAWQAWSFLHVAKTLASVGENEVCLEIIFRADAIFVGRWKGFKNAFSETVVEFDLGHDDDSVWQVQDFGCLGLIFRGRRSTL